ncbi:neuronal acetylcholine receptor subunit alpha-10 isoform X2 [Nematostella vectensis]|uniref:neuronal acetylcholine receptor subunit alpha-10 isoform X2 n=1 Tax=Nematostella vectensis TaxID=45351 RepID=UPI00207779F2|nr:neuronal acetylcholine receptor subunit alpha-10 isoform X2 [Nematostella vectensis]
MGRIFGIFLIVVCIVPAFSSTSNYTDSLSFPMEDIKKDQTYNPINSQQDDNELRLIKDLFFRGYNKNVRPVEDKSMPVEVKFGIAYTQVVDLIEKDQVLISNIWVRMNWNNHLLRWNASEYGGIDKLNISPTLMWLPDIVLHNNAEENVPAGTLYQFKTKVQLFNDGLCVWYAPTIIQSGCNIDITYFPFDDQLCELKFGSWTYNGLEVNIVQMLDQADLKFYMKSSEFQLISAKAKRNVNTFSCCPEPYPDVTFYLHLRRKPGFFLYNIIIPCLVITSLAVLTFVLPPEIGERVTLVIESFLALSFVVLMVSDSVPVTSDNTPLIVKFLLISMCEIGGALVANCISLNLYKLYPMPQWVRVVFLHYLARMLCIDTGHPKSDVDKDFMKLDTLEKKLYNVAKKHSESRTGSSPTSPLLSHQSSPSLTDHHLGKIADGMAAVARCSQLEVEAKINKDFWIFTSRIVDRMFLLVFIVAFIVSSGMIFSQVPEHYGIF